MDESSVSLLRTDGVRRLVDETGVCQGILKPVGGVEDTSAIPMLGEPTTMRPWSLFPWVDSGISQSQPATRSDSLPSSSCESVAIMTEAEHGVSAEVHLPRIENPFPAPAKLKEVDATTPGDANIYVLLHAPCLTNVL